MDTQEQQSWVESFYAGLKDLVDSTFPKKCNKCGKIYQTKQEFLNETIPVRDISLEDQSGLFSLEGDEAETVVGVFRNCKCGTTLMADFQDRRDTSPSGQARRDEFEKLLVTLIEHGLDADLAHAELLKVLRGQNSPVIEDMLGDVRLR